MYRRRIVITLPAPDYSRLAEFAAREDRAVESQASYVLRQVLSAPTSEGLFKRLAQRGW